MADGRPKESQTQLSSPADPAALSADERTQIAARLRLTPAERLRYLVDMLAFEGRARLARRVG